MVQASTFFLSDDPSKNIYQVTNQITIDHRDYNGRTSRFDVTLLVNGLPLVQIELKKRGMEIAEALIKRNAIFVKPIGQGKGCLVLFSCLSLVMVPIPVITPTAPQASSLPFRGRMLPTNISMKLSILPMLFKSAASNPNADPVHGAARNHQKPDGAASLSDLCSTENCGACAKLRSERLYLAHYRFRQNPDLI
jgi:hypothetical protein